MTTSQFTINLDVTKSGDKMSDIVKCTVNGEAVVRIHRKPPTNVIDMTFSGSTPLVNLESEVVCTVENPQVFTQEITAAVGVAVAGLQEHAFTLGRAMPGAIKLDVTEVGRELPGKVTYKVIASVRVALKHP